MGKSADVTRELVTVEFERETTEVPSSSPCVLHRRVFPVVRRDSAIIIAISNYARKEEIVHQDRRVQRDSIAILDGNASRERAESLHASQLCAAACVPLRVLIRSAYQATCRRLGLPLTRECANVSVR